MAVLPINQEKADDEAHHSQGREYKLPLSATRSCRHKRDLRTSTKSDLPLSISPLSSSFGLRGFGCSAVLKSFDSSKKGSDFLFLVWRRTLCDPADSRPGERELESCSTITTYRFACLRVAGLKAGVIASYSSTFLTSMPSHSEELGCAGSQRLRPPRMPTTVLYSTLYSTCMSEPQLPQRLASSASFYTWQRPMWLQDSHHSGVALATSVVLPFTTVTARDCLTSVAGGSSLWLCHNWPARVGLRNTCSLLTAEATAH